MFRNFTEFIKIPESIRIPVLGGIWYRLITELENKSIQREKIPENPLNKEKRDIKITVSLTSFPARIEYVHLAIKSLMLQSVKPDRIILWLAKDQFPDKMLPSQLTELQKYGLEICWTVNIYGHKKYFNSLKEQVENEVVITYDDDLIYPPNSIKKLIKTYKKHPSCIICNRAQALCYDNNGNIKNPGRWDTISNIGLHRSSFQLCPSTGGGCLYPFKTINLNLLDQEMIEETALKGDDLWIMFIAAQSETMFIKTCKYHKSFSTISGSQSTQLSTGNLINDEYIDTLDALIKIFPNAWNRILTDKE